MQLYNYITTVYRSYGAHCKAVAVLVAVIGIEHVVSTCVSNAFVRVH